MYEHDTERPTGFKNDGFAERGVDGSDGHRDPEERDGSAVAAAVGWLAGWHGTPMSPVVRLTRRARCAIRRSQGA